MIERLIENWLSNANERGYEVPFCQLLMAEGHRIIHLNRHSPTEQGKDIISIDSKGKLSAYQLKGGDIDIGRWRREIKPEVDALVENIVEHPAVDSGFAIPHLVTNGRLTEPVVAQVTNLNRSNQRRRLKVLRVVVGTDLVARFVSVHGQFLPREPKDFDAFLRLFLANGRDMLPKARFARFLQAQLNPAQLTKPTDIVRAIASAVILAAYALSAYQRAENHFALFEGWVLIAAAIARLAEVRRLPRKSWGSSFDLAVGAARLALSNLFDETLTDRPLIEGDWRMDGGPPYRARVTLLIGTASARALIYRPSDAAWDRTAKLNEFIGKHERDMLLWGESAVPFFVCFALWLEQCGQAAHAEGVASGLIDAINKLNGPRSQSGLPGPYHSVVRCVAAICRVAPDPTRRDSPLGSSYSLDALIEFLVRRLRKQTLKLLWNGVTHIHLSETEYATPTDFYLWRTPDGQLIQRYVKRPQPWSELVERANENTESKLPETLQTHREFAIMFALVYPHRFGRALLKLLESATTVEPPAPAPGRGRGRRGRKT
ncbi:MAG: hypothetical protein IT449_07270 [Phycisphaerales bacterium]|nr:hypothetical protein [Phycisphaerales bacterium]